MVFSFSISLPIIRGSFTYPDIKDARTVNLSNRTNLNLPNTYFEHFHNIQVLLLDNNTGISIHSQEALFIQERLVELSLKFCGITKIFNMTFSELPSLTKLYLSNNKIVYIGADAFDRNPELDYLYLNNNQLVKFNNAHYLRNLQRLFLIDLSGNREFSFVNDSIKHNFFTSYNLFKIICRHCNLVGIHREMFSSWEYLLDIDLSHNNIREVSVNAFDPLEHLGYINLSYNPLSKIQLNHSRARNLICVHCSINEIGDSLKDVPDLQMIDYSYNFISFVPEDAFKHNPKMLRIILNENKLRMFSYQIVTLLPRLNTLCLDENLIEASYETSQLQDIYIQRNLRLFCPNVSEPFESSLPRIVQKDGTVMNKKIHHHDCPRQHRQSLAIRDIIYLNPQYYKNCPTINSLTMSGNSRFEFLVNQAFLESVFIQNFTCDMCNISNIYSETFTQLPDLRVLSLQHNSIQLLRDDTFQGNSEVRELYLEGNDIKQLSHRIVDNLPKIEKLSLGRNLNFKLASHRIFVYSETLIEFECNACAIDRLTSIMFDYMPNLEILQLDNYIIETIEVATFRYNIHLRKISFDGNLMKTFSSDVIINLQSLREICMDWKQFHMEIKSEKNHNPLLRQIEESIRHHKGHQCKYLDSTCFRVKPILNFILFYRYSFRCVYR